MLNLNQIKVLIGKVEARHVRLGLACITLTFFILGAGAPGESCTNC